MKIILIYLLLITFYIDQVIGGIGFSHIMKGISLFNLNIYLLLFVWAIDILQRRKVFQSNNVNKYIVLMGFIVLTSILVKILHGEIPNISIKKEIIEFKRWLNPVLLFFILFNILEDKEICNRTLLGLYFLFLALILTQLFAAFGIIGYKASEIAQYDTVAGFGATGEYSITLVLFFPFVVSGIFFMKRSSMFKIGSIILAFLILLSLVNAGSRNGAVSFLFCTMVYFLILKRKKIMGMLPIVFLIYVMIVVGATAFFASPSNIKIAITEKFDPSSYSNLNKFTSGRILLWSNGWKLFVDSPIFGHGRNSYMKVSKLRGYPVYGPPHNEFLRSLVDHGLIGLIVFILIFFKIFQNIWQSLKETKDPNGKYLYISYIAGLCGYMTGMFATNTDPSLYIFWIYTAVVYKHAQLDMDRKETSEVKSESITTHAGMTQSV